MGLALPGTAYVAGGPSGVNASQYESQFNSSAIAGSWSGTPFSGIPVIGDIFTGFAFAYQNIRLLVDGLPSFLLYMKETYIVDATAQLSFDVIANALRAIYAFMFVWFLIEFISGRIPSD